MTLYDGIGHTILPKWAINSLNLHVSTIMTSIVKPLFHHDLDIWKHPLRPGQVRSMVEKLAIPESTHYDACQDESDRNT